MYGFRQIRWTILTPSGEYCPRVSAFEAPPGEVEAEKAEQVWFFGRCALVNLDEEAVRGALELYESVRPVPFSCPAEDMDGYMAEYLASSLDLAVHSGQIRFEKLARTHVAEGPRQEAEEATVAPAEARDVIEAVLVDDSGRPS